MAKERLNFYFGRFSSYFGGEPDPVGSFLDGYPTVPGRYQFEPYRGMGHARFTRQVEKGPAVCTFTVGWKTVCVVITAEEYVDCKWFLQVSKLWSRPRGVIIGLALFIGMVAACRLLARWIQ